MEEKVYKWEDIVTHKIPYKRMEYPVGTYIEVNLPIIRNMAEAIISLRWSQIAFCCMGSSGAIIAGILASMMPSNISVVILHFKKDGEISHNSGVSLDYKLYKSLFVDDFIASGTTLKTVNNRYYAIYGKYMDAVCFSDYTQNTDWKPDVVISHKGMD